MRVGLVALFFATLIILEAPAAAAAAPTSFSGAFSAVQRGFVAVKTAGNDGGNVTALVAELNGALALIQKASSENSTNPEQASADLASAVTLAEEAQVSASAVGQQGLSAGRFKEFLSILYAWLIISLSCVIYIYGDKIYRRLWLRVYAGQVVRKTG